MAHDVLRVLAECHRQGICYADIKPANFLLKSPYEREDSSHERLEVDPVEPLHVKVSDFGCSQRVVKVLATLGLTCSSQLLGLC